MRRLQPKRSDDSYYVCQIVIGPLEKKLPFVSNAESFLSGFGPGGGGGGLRFATSDNRYAIAVELINDLSDTAVDPKLDVPKLARLISESYDRTRQKPGGPR